MQNRVKIGNMSFKPSKYIGGNSKKKYWFIVNPPKTKEEYDKLFANPKKWVGSKGDNSKNV